MPTKTVLLIDDERDQRDIYRTVLQHAGYGVLEAETAAEGLRAARESLPDLILLDMALPGMDGWNLVSLLKSDDSTAAIQVCAISARALIREEEVRKVREAGLVSYLLKPIEPKLVLKVVTEWIGPAREL